MGGTTPGADELRVAKLLKQRGVGPDAEQPVIPPIPKQRPRDWLDNILDGNATSAAELAPELVEEPAEAPGDEDPEPAPERNAKKEGRKPGKGKGRARKRRRRRKQPAGPDVARSAWDTKPSDPRKALVDAWSGVPYRLKWLGCHLAAAGVGWRIGLVDWATSTAAWYGAGHWTSPSAFVIYVFGVCAIALYRVGRKRGLWLVTCAAAIPVSSVVVGVLLYSGTGR
ncbi:hypothetical protein ACFYOF_16915 [Streptomyces sp. NPDC007148]|uniref:hypothetical protein n=1 Tax=Streptomyces sp. NPDC007148 TaxID=3364775 RepID=UPI0036CD46C3